MSQQTQQTALWSEIKTVKDLYMAPFLCAFTKIITLKSSFQENRIAGYEFVNEKVRKEWCNTYENGDLLCKVEY